MTDQFEGQLLAEIPKNQREVYRISQREYKGHHLVDLRVWFIDQKSGELLPSNKGISLKTDCLPEIIKALNLVEVVNASQTLPR